MNNVSGPSQNYQTLAPSYAPLGKPTAGLESAENKDQTLPPVEETGANEKNRNQPNQKADAVAADARGGSGKSEQQAAQLTEEEEPQTREPAATDRAVRAAEVAQLIVPAQIQLALQRIAALQNDNGRNKRGGVDASTAVDSFNSAAGHTSAPGSLFDQRS